MYCYVKCLLFENCGDQLKRSLDETSFVNRHINLIVHQLFSILFIEILSSKTGMVLNREAPDLCNNKY